MSEKNKEGYAVGIPLDELLSQESSADEEMEKTLPDHEPEAKNDPAELPDLFDPEELAEVGLTTELAEPDEIEPEDGNVLPSLGLLIDEDELPEDVLNQDTADDAEEPSLSDSLLAEPTEAVAPIENTALPEVELLPALGDEDAGGEAPPDSGVDLESLPPLIARDDIETAVDDDVDQTPETGDNFIDQDLLVGRLESLGHQIDELHREFEGKLKYDAHKDEVIDRLHSELQEYKQDIIKKYVLSIVMDVVKVADDIRKWLTYFRTLEVSQRDPRKLFRYLEAIPSDLEDVFYWHGVKPFSNQEGSFDPARQRAIKKVPTDDPALDKGIAHSIRPGYEWETKVIRQEMVAVYVYQEEQESMNTGMINE